MNTNHQETSDMKTLSRLTLVLATALLAWTTAARAQDYPSRPITIIVPTPPGGGSDIVARLIAQKWSDKIGKPVIIENVPGAGTNIGAAKAARSKPDGYTLLMSFIGTHALNPHLYKTMPFKQSDLEPIAPTGFYDILIVSNPNLPVNNVRELIDYARANPKKINFGSSGVGSGSHIMGSMFATRTGVELTHVPYKGAGEVVGAILANTIQLGFDGLIVMGPQIRAGKLKGLALMSEKRNKFYPDIPTLAEQGIGDINAEGWFSLFAPAGIPEPTMKIIKETVYDILRSKDYQDKIQAAGYLLPPKRAMDDFKGFVADEYKRWGPIVNNSGATLE
jgi:tripartite-type tricarboxylate transporter receptor subunit TctC